MVGRIVRQIRVDVVVLGGDDLVNALQTAAKPAARARVLALDDGVGRVQPLLRVVVVVPHVVVPAAEQVETAWDYERDGAEGTV